MLQKALLIVACGLAGSGTVLASPDLSRVPYWMSLRHCFAGLQCDSNADFVICCVARC
jgi:hypothetical protein